MIKLYFNNLSGIFGGYTGVIAASFAYISEVDDNIEICVLLFLQNSASSFHRLSSSIFNVRSSFVRPASVTPPLISTI